MEPKSNRTGFTKLGFSKSGFGACSQWASCSMGKFECHYAAVDPEVKEYCHCYQRNHYTPKQKVESVQSVETKVMLIETKEVNFYKFDNLETRLLGKALTPNFNTKAGELYILRPTNQNSGTHFFVNSFPQNKWLGSYKVEDFEIVKEFPNEDELLANVSTENKNVKEYVREEMDFNGMEQLSLFL